MSGDFKKSTLREYFESIVIAVILALFIRTFVVQAAEGAKDNCPISGALKGNLELSVDAQLA